MNFRIGGQVQNQTVNCLVLNLHAYSKINPKYLSDFCRPAYREKRAAAAPNAVSTPLNYM